MCKTNKQKVGGRSDWKKYNKDFSFVSGKTKRGRYEWLFEHGALKQELNGVSACFPIAQV